jgi:hypothetical protein
MQQTGKQLPDGPVNAEQLEEILEEIGKKLAEQAEADDPVRKSMNAKVQAAISAAIASGDIDPNKPVGVGVHPDGTISVFNTDEGVDGEGKANVPDQIELPPMFQEDGRESLADTTYADHLAEHWGF